MSASVTMSGGRKRTQLPMLPAPMRMVLRLAASATNALAGPASGSRVPGLTISMACMTPMPRMSPMAG